MPVNTAHPDYSDAQTKWTLVQAAVRGVDENNAEEFIEKRSGEEQEGGDVRYRARLAKAIYTNYTKRTKAGLLGAIYRQPPDVEVPDSIKFIVENADGAGQSLQQLSKCYIAAQLEDGSHGVLVDYPAVEKVPTKEQQRKLNLRASLKSYESENIINFKTQVVGGITVLALVVLAENLPSSEDEFDHDGGMQYRALRLRDGAYTQEVYDADGESVIPEFSVLDGNGKTFDHIPFYFIGAENNLPGYNDPVLYDIAVINIGHFRNSADWENNLSIHSGGTIVIGTDMTNEEWKKANGEGPVMVGEGNGIRVSGSGFAELLQLDSAQAIMEEMKNKEERMRQIGARIIAKDRDTNETAKGAGIRASSENSILDTMVSNVDETIIKALGDVLLFEGGNAEGDIEFKLNRDYWVDALDPQLAMALIQLNDIGALPIDDIIRHLQEKDLINKSLTVEQVKQIIAEQSPLS